MTMRFPTHAALAALALSLVAGCVRRVDPYASAGAGYPGLPPSAPTPAPMGPDEWARADADAAAAAQASGATQLSQPLHLSQQGYAAEQRVQLEGGKCYALGVGWTWGGTARVSVMFERDAQGRGANDQLGGRNGELAGPGVVQFCADHDGVANVSVSALSAERVMLTNELLEYSLVLGSRRESPAEASQRRVAEAGSAAASQAQMDANVAAAEERDRRNRQARCSECEEDRTACRVARAHGGTFRSRRSINVSSNCDTQFLYCVYGSTIDVERHRGEDPCAQ